MEQKQKLRVSDAHAIAVLKGSSLNRNVVDESAVKTFQIQNYKLIILFLDLGVTARNRGVGEAERGCGLSPDHHRKLFDGKDGSFKSSGNCCKSRVHRAV